MERYDPTVRVLRYRDRGSLLADRSGVVCRSLSVVVRIGLSRRVRYNREFGCKPSGRELVALTAEEQKEISS